MFWLLSCIFLGKTYFSSLKLALNSSFWIRVRLISEHRHWLRLGYSGSSLAVLPELYRKRYSPPEFTDKKNHGSLERLEAWRDQKPSSPTHGKKKDLTWGGKKNQEDKKNISDDFLSSRTRLFETIYLSWNLFYFF